MADRTVFRVLEEAAEVFGYAPALHQPYMEDGKRKLRTLSWVEYKTAAEEIAAGLRTLGIRKGDIVALDSETRLEFYLADLGIMANGSVAAAMYPNLPVKELVRTVQACDAKALFAEDPKTLEQFKDAPIQKRFLLTGEAAGAITLYQLREFGRAAIARDPTLLSTLRAEVQPSDDAVLYLTSGATGEPKMVMVSHRALVSNIDMGPVALGLTPKDRTVAFLPSAHIAQRVVVELVPIRLGMPVTFTESLMKLPQEIKTVRPTIFLAPPRLWERVYATICTELKKKPAAIQKLFYTGLALGLAAARHRRKGERVPVRIRAPLAVVDRIVFAQVRGRFGGKMAIPASGAAPLGTDLAEFYEAVGMPLVEGYGLTEGGVVSLNPLDDPKPGSIGKALPGVEVRIADDGELLVRSPCLFSRYYKDPAGTAEVLRDGWLHTGDIASMDDDGYLFITGRKKEMIVTSSGKKIYPSRVESLFKFEPLISQVILIGDRLPYLTALFTINTGIAELLDGMKEYRGRPAAITDAPPVRAELTRIVQRVNKQLAPFEQVRKFRVISREFSIEEGELTATMKVRRMRVLENFRDHIEELYAGKEESH
ncbi:MAG TPA: AMP-dependent synthetase/ligase [Bryobacteraceae bacterium]|nr:AMP-dependent synthetase/ligase [Bryobacteraceae bacterium]